LNLGNLLHSLLLLHLLLLRGHLLHLLLLHLLLLHLLLARGHLLHLLLLAWGHHGLLLALWWVHAWLHHGWTWRHTWLTWSLLLLLLLLHHLHLSCSHFFSLDWVKFTLVDNASQMVGAEQDVNVIGVENLAEHSFELIDIHLW
jgi:hypothetical protein